MLKKILENKKIKQKEFAKMVGLAESTISRYINGERVPKGDNLLKMAETLNINPKELLRRK